MKSLPKKAHIDVVVTSEEGGGRQRLGQVYWPHVQRSFYEKKTNFKPNVAKQKQLFSLSGGH